MKKEGSLKHLLNEDWQTLLKNEFDQPYFVELEAFVTRERLDFPNQIFPPHNQIFNALNHCKLDELKVIILGQDPYHGEGQANGFSFSVSADTKIPPSLANIFKELQNDLNIEKSRSGDLSNWADQGVLLLNNVLTVRAGQANSHAKKGWEQFTDAILHTLNDKLRQKVYLLWGKDAHKKASFIDTAQNFVLKTSHPSPLGCSKEGSDFVAFSGSNCFSKTNSYLIDNGLSEIVWRIPQVQLGLFD